MKNQLKTYFVFLSILLCLNTIYFYIYVSFLGLHFSWLHLFFLVIGNISYSLLLLIFKLKLLRIITYIFISAFFFWSLMNFAYFSVFNTFLDFSVGQMSQVDLNFLGFLKDFLYLVPIRLYLVSIVVLTGIIVNSILYSKFLEKKNQELLYKPVKLNLLLFRKKRTKAHYKLFALLAVFIFVNLGAFGTCAYLSNSPRISWWQVEKQIADLGVWGHFYNQVYAKFEKNDYELVEVVETGLLEQEVEKTDLEKTKDVLKQMQLLGNKKPSKYSLPLLPEKPNILVVQLESLPQWIVDLDPTPMPYLKALMKNNITVDNFYANSCQTINAEFSSLCSFWPNSEEPISYSHKKNEYNCLPSILKAEHDYETFLFHSDYLGFWDRSIFATSWGFDNLYFVPHYILKQDDISVFSDAIDILSEKEDPFFAYLISFSTHGPHDESMYIYNRHANNLELQPYDGEMGDILDKVDLTEEETRNYLGFTLATDKALEVMMDKMKNSGLLENTIVIIYNDHKYYGFKGDDLESWQLTNKSPMVVVLPEKIRAEIQSVASHVDIAPTVLNLVEQGDYYPRDNFVGQSLFDSTFGNQVLNKCLGEVYYVNQDINIRGNVKTGLYQVFDKNKKITQTEDWINLVKELVEISDKTIYGDGLLGGSQE